MKTELHFKLLGNLTEDTTAGISPAQRLLDLYHTKWGENVDPVFRELLY